MLDADPHADVIHRAMERAAGALRGLLAAPAGGDPLNAAGAASTEVATVRARYQVSGQVTDGAGFEVGRAIIVSVVQLTPTLPSPEQLQERWGLSPQEARVALLLAQGRSNADVAAEMDLSPATVRHYTESVFHKLGVHSRAEVGRRILLE